MRISGIHNRGDMGRYIYMVLTDIGWKLGGYLCPLYVPSLYNVQFSWIHERTDKNQDETLLCPVAFTRYKTWGSIWSDLASPNASCSPWFRKGTRLPVNWPPFLLPSTHSSSLYIVSQEEGLRRHEWLSYNAQSFLSFLLASVLSLSTYTHRTTHSILHRNSQPPVERDKRTRSGTVPCFQFHHERSGNTTSLTRYHEVFTSSLYH